MFRRINGGRDGRGGLTLFRSSADAGLLPSTLRVPSSGLMAFWERGKPGAGTVWNGQDTAGLNSALDGALTNGAVWGAGRTAQNAVAFGGSGAYVAVPAALSVKGLLAASVALWFKPTANPSSNAGLYFEATSSSGYTRFALFHQSSGNAQAVMRDNDSAGSFAVASPSALTIGTWVHLCATVDSVTDILTLYVNGVSVGTNTVAKGAFTNTAPNGTISVGAFGVGSTNPAYANGSLEDVALYSRCLSAAEVTAIFNSS